MILLDEFLLHEGYIYAIFIWMTFLTLSVIGVYIVLNEKLKKKSTQPPLQSSSETANLKIQALERLTLFAERIALKNVSNRLATDNKSVVNTMMDYTNAINEEFGYNSSMQLYVSADIWKAINDYKDQNIFIVGQVANTLPAEARGEDLVSSVQTLMQTPNADLSAIIIDALRYEAKKLI